MNANDLLPLRQVLHPETEAEVAALIRSAVKEQTPLYPLGGGTSLDLGLPASQEGDALSTSQLNRVIDYPDRDMTITVESGLTMAALAETLAEHGQQLPIDVPQAEQATIGGVVASNWNGPRRYGLGAVRDYVIGVSAVDGRGVPFHGGGRVVKNVAGYDFCKLLTGSLGTLAMITSLTLKLRPAPEARAMVAAQCLDFRGVETLFAAQAQSATPLAGLELLSGPYWTDGRLGPAWDADGPLLVGWIEGSEPEVKWGKEQLQNEWRGLGHESLLLEDASFHLFHDALIEFPASNPWALSLKAVIRPSGVAEFAAAIRDCDPNASFRCHAGNGIVHIGFETFPAEGLSRTLIAKLQPTASRFDGAVVVLSNPSGAEMTRQSVWGPEQTPAVMNAVKKQFDPHNLLNPGRFVYSH